MLKNIKKKRFISALLVAVMCLGLIPLGAFSFINASAATTYTAIDKDGLPVSYTVTGTISQLATTTINNDTTGVYLVEGDTFNTGNDRGRIIVRGGSNVVLILNNAVRENFRGNAANNNETGGYFNSASASPLQVAEGSTVTLVLLDGTTNRFTSNGYATPNYSVQAGINVAAGSTLIIQGQEDNTGKLIAQSGAFSAGIGGGVNAPSGNITIEGGIVEATARIHDFQNWSGGEAFRQRSGNGAGIGGGGGSTAEGRGTGEIIIRGNAIVTAISEKNGAGIGSGGTSSSKSESSGSISIYGNATVTATSMGDGAGIGGGGSDSNNAGASEVIRIYGNAKVYAESKSTGAGIGGGGSLTGTPGASVLINISGNPIVVPISADGYDIGPGVDSSNDHAIAGDIRIIGGNVYVANKITEVKNTPGQTLSMVHIKMDPGTTTTYTVQGPTVEYLYTVTANASGDASLWLPAGSQLVICEDEYGDELGHTIIRMEAGVSTEITPLQFKGYDLSSTTPVQTITWNGADALTPIVYQYVRSQTGALRLEAYDSKTGAPIDSLTHTITDLTTHAKYDFLSDVPALTAKVNAAYPNDYAIAPQALTTYYIDPDKGDATGTNVVKVYYTPLLSGAVHVEARVNNQSGHLLLRYAIPAIPGETITLDEAKMPDLTGFGFAKNATASDFVGTEGATPTDFIVLVYSDNRIVTNVLNNLDSDIITDKMMPGDTKILYPPHKTGYVATEYSVNGGAKQPISSIPTGYAATTNTDITFYYEAPADSRFTTVITNSVDSDTITDKTQAGDTKRLYPPHKDGYTVKSYSLNGSSTQSSIPAVGYVEATVSTNIEFQYELSVTPATHFTTTISNNIDADVINDKTPTGDTKRLYPSHKDGYNIKSYSLNGSSTQTPIPGVGYVTTTVNTNIEFQYELSVTPATHFITTISNNIDSNVINDKTPTGDTKRLYPTHKEGYKLTGYSLNNGVTKSAIPSAGYVAVTASADVIFYYEVLLAPTVSKFTTVIRNNVDTNVIIYSAVVGDTHVLYPPHKDGYIATEYSINGGTTKMPIPSVFTGYSATTDTNIIFYYEAIKPNTGGNSGGSSGGGSGSGGSSNNDEDTYNKNNVGVGLGNNNNSNSGSNNTTNTTGNNTSANNSNNTQNNSSSNNTSSNSGNNTTTTGGNSTAGASGSSGSTGAGGSSGVNKVNTNNADTGGIPSPVRVTNAILKIMCVDTHGNEIYTQPITSVVGSVETIIAPPLEGYVLADSESPSQIIEITSGENVVTFMHVKVDDVATGDIVQNSTSYWWILAFLCGAGLMFVICFFKRKKEQQS